MRNRIAIYVRSTTACLIELIVLCVLGLFIAVVNEEIGLLLIVLSLPFVFFHFHYMLTKHLLHKHGISKLYAIPVIAVAILILVLKIYVNEISDLTYPHDVSELSRLVNYILYILWTGTVLWEIFIVFLKHKNYFANKLG
jgi:hypothetical protein